MKTALNTEIEGIPHAGVRALVEAVLAKAPECFWSMPAATTGKYHPAISLGEGGLVRHTKAVYRITRHLLEMTGTAPGQPLYSIALAAALLHDCCKKADDEKFTAFDHPLRAAELIQATAVEVVEKDPALVQDLTPSAVRSLRHIVAAHMGRWNTSAHSQVQLPVPLTPLERLVHTADYLASRKDITVADIT